MIRKGAILQRITPFLDSISLNLSLHYYEIELIGMFCLFVFSIDSLNLLLHLIHIIFEFLDATIHFVNKAVALL